MSELFDLGRIISVTTEKNEKDGTVTTCVTISDEGLNAKKKRITDDANAIITKVDAENALLVPIKNKLLELLNGYNNAFQKSKGFTEIEIGNERAELSELKDEPVDEKRDTAIDLIKKVANNLIEKVNEIQLGGGRRPKKGTKKSKKGCKRASRKSRGGSKLVSSPYTGGKRKSRGKAKK